jgi:ABC-2 type transport system ATP-binding protein
LNKEHGVTIIVSSHILAEIERMASHVGIIHKGKMLFQGTLTELQQMKQRKSFLQVETDNNHKAIEVLNNYNVEEKNGLVVIPYSSKQETSAINKLLVANNIEVYLLQPQQNDLEQLFIDITSDN